MRDVDHVWLFAGGNFTVEDISQCSMCADKHAFVAVDRGVEHCLEAGIAPDLIVGDFDSASAAVLADTRLEGVRRLTYPARKNASDLEIALHLLAETPPRKVTMVGISGGRTDHMLFNWQLPILQAWPFEIDLVDSSVHAFVVTPERHLEVNATHGQLLSILAFEACEGVSVSGVEYPLARASLHTGSTLGLSNRVVGNMFNVSLSSGRCLVMLIKDTH